MSAGIEAAVHLGYEVVDGNYDTDDWGFILVDARNAFNDLNRYTMLWMVRHLWPSVCWDIILSLLKDRGHPGVCFLNASLRIGYFSPNP